MRDHAEARAAMTDILQNSASSLAGQEAASEFEIRARGLDALPHRRGAAAEGWRVAKHKLAGW